MDDWIDKYTTLDDLTKVMSPKEMAGYLYANCPDFTFDFIEALHVEVMDDKLKNYDSYEDWKKVNDKQAELSFS